MPRSAGWTIRFAGEARPLCCAGCEAVALAILEQGLEEYYLHREDLAPGAPAPLPPRIERLRAWDHPVLQRGFVRRSESEREVSLLLENLRCAACVWLAEKTLSRLPGVLHASIDFAACRAQVRWDPDRAELSGILAALARIGLVAHPFEPGRAHALLEAERRDRLLRFLVAGALGMQVMTLAVALYAGAFSGMETPFRDFFRWTSLVLTAPVLAFSGWPFFTSALEDLRKRRVGMDVPVSLGLFIAFAGSSWATWSGEGEVYFDSVVMFLFLLHGARLLENGARRRALRDLELLERPVPATARRVTPDGGEELLASADLRPGDRVRVRAGEALPADGIVLEGASSVDEALLTGESLPVSKSPGDAVIGGAINVESPLDVRVTAVGEATVLASLERLVDRARGSKPAIARLADRVAARFSLAVVLLAAVVAAVWWRLDPDRLLPTVIAVLVVSCPCALSLATPLALAASSGALARRGMLITREAALETLARADVAVFDKTGTLTQGRPEVAAILLGAGSTQEEVLALAAGLERDSEHPLARSIREAAGGRTAPVEALCNHPGQGVVGRLLGETCAVGAPAFVALSIGTPLSPQLLSRLADGRTPVAVGRAGQALSLLLLEDALRPGARELVDTLTGLGIECLILSGDHPAVVARVAAELGVRSAEGEASPERKVERIRELVAGGRTVAMIGDGINDAAALSAATVSVAMGSGAFLAASSSDAVLASSRSEDLGFAFGQARRTMRVIRGNFGRALSYNAIILPIAAAGFVPPWAAALGMTASSVFVVINAMRLRRAGRRVGELSSSAGLAGQPLLEPAAG